MRVIADTAQMAQLMGARTVLTGLQPAVAITLTELGLRLPQIKKAVSLEKGLEMLEERTRTVIDTADGVLGADAVLIG